MNTQKPDATLYQKAVQGGVWLFTLRYFSRAMDLVKAVVLARLLLPQDFGQMAIALLSVSILDTFTQVGVSEALIQRKEDIHEHLDTAWTIGVLRGILIFILLFFIAPWICLFFESPGVLRPTDVHVDRLLQQVQQHPDPAVAYLLDCFQEETREFLISYDPKAAVPAAIKDKLLEDLNQVISSQTLWEESAFSSISLTARAKKILSQKIRAGDRDRANRLLLEELFAEGNGIQPAVLDRTLVTGIIQVVGFVYFLGTLANIGVVYFNRELQFARQFLLRSIGLLGGTVVAIVVAYRYRSVWALALGWLAEVALICVLSYLLHPYRPRWSFDLDKARSLWKYGQHIMWATIAEFMIQQGDAIFVGKILGPATLGLYRYAHRFSNLGSSEVQGVLSQVTFPAFSRIQDNREKVISGYKKTIRYITILAYPICGGLLVLAHEFVSVVLGPNWTDMVPAMQVLCLFSALCCVQTGIIYRSMGRPDLVTRVSFVRLGIILLSIYPLTYWLGLAGTALSILLSVLFIFPLQFGYLRQLIGVSLLDFLRLVFVPFAGTIIMVICLTSVKPLLPLGDLGRLAVLTVIGAIIYSTAVYLLSHADREYSPYQLYTGIRKGWK